MSAEGHRLALLGAGRMGQAVLVGLLDSGWPKERLVVAEAHPPTADMVHAAHHVQVLDSERAVVDADVVVLAVKPQQVGMLLDDIAAHLPAHATVISLAAGVPTIDLASRLPRGTAIVRVMPNTPALIGQGMSVMSPAMGCPPESVALARDVLSAIGEVREVPESAQDAVTAVSGSGPAYVFYVAEAMIEAGVLLGLPRPLAHDLTVQTLVGAAAMLRDADEHPSVLRENVTSPGGTTAAALHVLDSAAVRAAIADAMRACRDRSAELSR